MIRPTHACVDRDALRSNIRAIGRRLRPGTRTMAVVKANCYGHGIEHCLPTMLEEGIDTFGVATVEEGNHLRTFGLTERIVVLPPPLEGQYAEYVRLDLEALVSDARTAGELSRVAEAAGRRLRLHLHVDTGMTRNGADPAEALELARNVMALPAVELVGVASHFATSDETDRSYALRQHQRFESMLAQLRDAGVRLTDIHLANSGGVLGFPDAQYTMVRPGLALYGYDPMQSRQGESELTPVLSLRTIVGGVKRIASGVPVSYGRSWSASTSTMIATLPIGYADGLMRALSNRLDVLIDGRRYRSVGRISMDETMVDLGPSTTVRPGDPVVIIGRSARESIDAWDLAAAAGTIPYEICTNISSRVPRRGVDASEPSTFSSTQ
jgi:alanine racemase